MDENNPLFLHTWQQRTISFDEDPPEKKADALRFSIVQMNILQNSSKREKYALDSHIYEALRDYSKLVDSRKSINNYAQPILHLLSNCKNESQNWKSNVKSEDLKSLLKKQTCPKFKDVDCKQAMELLRSSSFKEGSKPNKNSNLNEPSFDLMDTDSLSASEEDFLKMSGQIELMPNKQSSPFVRRPDQRNVPFARKESKKGQTGKKYPWQMNKRNEESPPVFKTASHQMAINNQKKFGSSAGGAYDKNSSAASGFGNPPNKRSLGTRRSISSKFVPPVKREDEDDFSSGISRRVFKGSSENGSGSQGENGPYAELMMDDRLKNIEAKMVELIMNEIMDSGATVEWDDIAGLNLAKNTIQEIVVWPMLRPDIFTGLRGPPKGILLFGPPGTGKTMIGKCIASQSQSTFFSISASSLTSKWVGEGEKMVRALFAVARCHQPAVIFIDEIDSLLTQRSDTEHESSRRIKTEFLVQLDGATCGNDERLLLIGATNRPQELDEAARRRLVKRLYIPLPETEARAQIMRNLLTNQRHSLVEHDIFDICAKTEGYSGADMANLCREAALGPIRSISMADIKHISVDEVRPISPSDFIDALRSIRASVSDQDLNMYEEWNRKYGINVVSSR